MNRFKNYARRLQTSRLFFTSWLFANIMILVLPVTSCRSTKQNTSISRAGSLQWQRKVSVCPVQIPAEIAQLRVPVDSLRNLPEGAVYTNRSGRATVRAEMKGDTILITAGCDSLRQVIYNLEEELVTTRAELVQKEKTISDSRSKYFIYGLLTGALLVTIILLLIKKKK
jgi:hypothetical protein